MPYSPITSYLLHRPIFSFLLSISLLLYLSPSLLFTMNPRAIIVSENFGDLLALSLPYNRHHFSEVLVVTSPQDEETIKVATANTSKPFLTNLFWKDGADFNKFLAIEAALDYFGREGWIALVDADTLWPKNFDATERLSFGKIHSFRRRRLLLDPTTILPREEDWITLPLDPFQKECMGFTQIFHCQDPVLGSPPWHRIDLSHASIGDSLFQRKWASSHKIWFDSAVLHIGNYGENWCGRTTLHRDGSKPKNYYWLKQRREDLVRRLNPKR